ncbi:MAG: hypothetical protein AAGK04_14805, partial [Planctomycetota bacterium]
MAPTLVVLLALLAQPEPTVHIGLPDAGLPRHAPPWIEPLLPEPGSPEWNEARDRGARERKLRQEIRALRHEHFSSGHIERRQVGLWKLR